VGPFGADGESSGLQRVPRLRCAGERRAPLSVVAGLAMPTEARFVDVAVGDGFVCGIVRVRQDPVRGLRHASDGCGHRVCGAGIGQVRQPLCCGALRLRGLCVQAQRCTSSSLTAEAEWWESKKNHVHQHRVLMELNET
jgi:hypothetical protein